MIEQVVLDMARFLADGVEQLARRREGARDRKDMDVQPPPTPRITSVDRAFKPDVSRFTVISATQFTPPAFNPGGRDVPPDEGGYSFTVETTAFGDSVRQFEEVFAKIPQGLPVEQLSEKQFGDLLAPAPRARVAISDEDGARAIALEE